jgi:hypothetical protein
VTKSPADLHVKPLPVSLNYGRDEHLAEALALKQALEQRGHEVLFEQAQLGHGQDWEHRAEQGMAWCGRVLLTTMPHSVRRPVGHCLNGLVDADWTPVAVVRVRRKKSIPQISARLGIAFDRCSPDLQARVLNRCLAVADLATDNNRIGWLGRGN